MLNSPDWNELTFFQVLRTGLAARFEFNIQFDIGDIEEDLNHNIVVFFFTVANNTYRKSKNSFDEMYEDV